MTSKEGAVSIVAAIPTIRDGSKLQEVEIPNFTKGESQCQTSQVVEKELKRQAA